MATVIEPRPLADLEMESVIAVEAAWGRRARGVKPQDIGEFLDAVAKVHARYTAFREWQRKHPQGVTR
jgi:cell division septum initiation protein DivIVA